MKNIKQILIKARDILYLVEEYLLIFVPQKHRKLAKDILNFLIVGIGAALAVIAIL